MDDLIEKMCDHTDLYPWYWLSYGEKCYGFAVVEAFPVKNDAKYPKPGSQLHPHEENVKLWVGENGAEMIIETWISSIEQQSGDVICSFIAAAHAQLMSDHLPTKDVPKPEIYE